jgi:hypothetical protein
MKKRVAVLTSSLILSISVNASPVLDILGIKPEPASSTKQGFLGSLSGSALVEQRVKETCFFQSERVDGMNKLCFYSCASGSAAITIGATSLCPLSIQR